MGRRRFDEFQSGTGIARNIRSARLHALVEDGIFDRDENAGPDRHVEYRLTKKGFDLYPVVLSLMRWGDTWMADEQGPPMTLTHRTCGHATTPALVCSHCRIAAIGKRARCRPTQCARTRRKDVARRSSKTKMLTRRHHETY